MKVGDYVRTKNGDIFKYIKTDEDGKLRRTLSSDNENITTGFELSDIIKSSPNIIGLIEIGDYVNGERVIYKQYKEYPNPLLDHYVVDTIRCSYRENEIKSIVTHEQFEKMQYNLESEVN